MKKAIIVVVTLFAMCLNVNAQKKAVSINVGFAPVGSISEKISLDDEKYKYNYKSYWSAVVGIEKQFKGVTTLTELTYAGAKFDKYDLQGTTTKFDPYQTADLKDFTLIQYFGTTLNANKRIQFPVYIGVGGEYISGGPFHNLAIDGALKARAKFYITDNIGIYAGGNFRYGYGMKKANDNKSSLSSESDYSISSVVWHIDAGVVISL